MWILNRQCRQKVFVKGVISVFSCVVQRVHTSLTNRSVLSYSDMTDSAFFIPDISTQKVGCSPSPTSSVFCLYSTPDKWQFLSIFWCFPPIYIFVFSLMFVFFFLSAFLSRKFLLFLLCLLIWLNIFVIFKCF